MGIKFPNLKTLNFLVWPQKFATNQLLYSTFPHPTPRIACQCLYAKEISWIGSKMTELKPLSWRTSKFLKTSLLLRIGDLNIFGTYLGFHGTGQIFGGLKPIFFCYPIITYISGWCHTLPLNPDFFIWKSKIPKGFIIPPPTVPEGCSK